MKMQFSRNRIVKTFVGYVIIILIPLAVLMQQGITSLKNYKGYLVSEVESRLQNIGNDFVRDLDREWEDFLSVEEARKFYHYQPLIIPEEDSYSGSPDSAVQRSPLYKRVGLLSNLHKVAGSGHAVAGNVVKGRLSPNLDEVISSSLVGYFQIGANGQIISPYFDSSKTFPTPPAELDSINAYHEFLTNNLKPYLFRRLKLEPIDQTRPTAVIQRLKTSRKTWNNVPVNSLLRFQDLYGYQPGDDISTLRVSYHAFHTFDYLNEADGVQYLVGLRPVVFGKNEVLALQGFLLNMSLFAQEAQAYLEPFQPEKGSVVVEETTATGKNFKRLYLPFNAYSVTFNKGDEALYLRNYKEQVRWFWTTTLIFVVVMISALVHLGRLIMANARLNRKKNDFVSAITHELKAPLTSIIMYAEMLEEGWVKGKEATYYRHIHGESERLSRLIKNILDFSGLERGVFKLKKNSLLLHTFVEETLDPLRVWIDNNGLKLNLEIKATPYVIADKDSLSQVLYNLCDNAIKYGLAVEGTSILTIIIDETETHARLVVYDNGPGVPKKEQQKVFNRFYRCENELTRESTGTGLGLALVKELVTGNDGVIELFQPPDHGFGVKISLPKVVIDPSLVSRPTPGAKSGN